MNSTVGRLLLQVPGHLYVYIDMRLNDQIERIEWFHLMVPHMTRSKWPVKRKGVDRLMDSDVIIKDLESISHICTKGNSQLHFQGP